MAAFLKDYGFVKEYGEGVDRMCRELAAVGLPNPAFNNDTFILKTTIRSAAYEKLPIEHTKVTDSEEKLPIEHAKVTDSEEKLPFQLGKVADSQEKLPIRLEKVAVSQKKLPFSVYELAYGQKDYSEPTIKNLCKLYDLIEVNQIFSSS